MIPSTASPNQPEAASNPTPRWLHEQQAKSAQAWVAEQLARRRYEMLRRSLHRVANRKRRAWNRAQKGSVKMNQLETCESCGDRIVRNPDQPRLCGACTPPSAARTAIYRGLAAYLAQRSRERAATPPAAEVAS